MADVTYLQPQDANTILPVELDKPKPIENLTPESRQYEDRNNLADNKELCQAVTSLLQRRFQRYAADRYWHERLWEVFDWMYECGQDDTIMQRERLEMDRQKNDATLTKTQKLGSTIFAREVASLRAHYLAVLFSQRDPFKLTSKYNPLIPYSGQQSEDLAMQHQLVLRTFRDQEDFTVKSIEFMTSLLKYGNVPMYWHWVRRSREVLDRWPKIKDKKIQLDPNTGRFLVDDKLTRKQVLTDNRFVCEPLDIRNFWADRFIENMEDQNCFFIRSFPNISDIIEGERTHDYLNRDQINETHLFKGGQQDDKLRRQQDLNAGLGTEVSKTDTGLVLQFDAYVALPIDESRSKNKLWEPKENAPKRYWVTVAGDYSNPVVLRIERNPDPDDLWSTKMIHHMPDDPKLYHTCMAQQIRRNYVQASIAKQQVIDTATLNNNRPIIALSDRVHMEGGGTLQYRRDGVTWEDEKGAMRFADASPQLPENLNLVKYLDNDSDETVGNNRATRGEVMGQRTGSTEAANAYSAAQLPHKIIVKYVLNQWLPIYGTRGIRWIHCYALDNQVIKLADVPERYQEIRPIELFGDFDMDINIIDDYENNIVQKQSFTFFLQSLLPVFGPILDLRKAWNLFAPLIVHKDAGTLLKPDMKDEQTAQAKYENMLMRNGHVVEPTGQDQHEIHIPIHESDRIAYRGAEGNYLVTVQGGVLGGGDGNQVSVAVLLDRHIEQHKAMEKQRMPMLPQGQQENTAPQSAGQAQGDQMAAQGGAMAGGGM